MTDQRHNFIPGSPAPEYCALCTEMRGHVLHSSATPPETPLAKAAILRLPMRNARQAVELDDLYRSIVDLAARVHSDDAREHMSEALLALDKASQLLRVVKP